MAHFKIYFTLVSMGSLVVVWKVSGDPVCYTRQYFDDHNSRISRVDCNSDPENIYMRFESSDDVTVGELLDGKLRTDQTTSEKSSEPTDAVNTHSSQTIEETELATQATWTEEMTEDYTFGWSSWNESRYLFVQIEKTWDDAKESCYSHDQWAHLVFIESDVENDFIIDLIDRELAKTGLSSDVWLGLIHVDGEWKWDNLNTTANLPASGPRKIIGDDASTYTDKVCAYISRSRGNGWHDKKCSRQYFFVCETRKVE